MSTRLRVPALEDVGLAVQAVVGQHAALSSLALAPVKEQPVLRYHSFVCYVFSNPSTYIRDLANKWRG